MEHARIALFEDQDAIRQMVIAVLGNTTHEVVAEAKTVNEALDVVQQVENGDIKIDVVMLDGNLDGGRTDCTDALKIATDIKKRGIPAVIIGFSTYQLQGMGIPVDFDLTKLNAVDIGQIINEL